MKMESYVGEDTVCTVEFDYSPEEEPIYYGPLANPGVEESVDVLSVQVGNGDFYDDLNEKCLERLEQECIDYVHLIGRPRRERDYD